MSAIPADPYATNAAAGSTSHAIAARDSKVRLVLTVIVTVLFALLALSFWQASVSLSKQACISEAVARFPAVPVSAYNGSQTGPLKLSFVTQRQQAISGCS